MSVKALFPYIHTTKDGKNGAVIAELAVSGDIPFQNDLNPEQSLHNSIIDLERIWRLTIDPKTEERVNLIGRYVHPEKVDFIRAEMNFVSDQEWDFGPSWTLAGIIQYIIESGRKPSPVFTYFKKILFTGEIYEDMGVFQIGAVGHISEKMDGFLAKAQKKTKLFVIPHLNYQQLDNKKLEGIRVCLNIEEFKKKFKSREKTILVVDENKLPALVDLLFGKSKFPWGKAILSLLLTAGVFASYYISDLNERRDFATLIIDSSVNGTSVILEEGTMMQKSCETPCKIEKILPGAYEIKLKKQGFVDIKETIVLKKGETYNKVVKMYPIGEQKSLLYVDSDPSKATIYINGERKTLTPAVVWISVGQENLLRVEKPGYYTAEQRIGKTRTNAELRISVTLKPTKKTTVQETANNENIAAGINTAGSQKETAYNNIDNRTEFFEELKVSGGEETIIKFTSDPSDAIVLVDGRIVCQATPCSKKVRIGKCTVTIQKENYLPVENVYDIKEGLSINAKLEPNFGWLTVNAPVGIDVILDGQKIGKTPVNKRVINSGGHQVETDNTCFYKTGEEFQTKRGENKVIALDLKPKESAIKVLARDAIDNDIEADVFVDGNKTGSAPGTFKIPLCSKEVVVKDKKNAFKQGLRLEEKKVTIIDAKLKPSEPQWSEIAPEAMNFYEAERYCKDLVEEWHEDWRLPTISELRELIQNCSSTESRGECNVNDCCKNISCANYDYWNKKYFSSNIKREPFYDIYSFSTCSGCPGITKKYSKFGDSGEFWSSSFSEGGFSTVWTINFDYGSIEQEIFIRLGECCPGCGPDTPEEEYYCKPDQKKMFRCIRDTSVL